MESQDLIIAGLAVAALLGALYLLTKPKPAPSDLSIGDAATLIKMYYGAA